MIDFLIYSFYFTKTYLYLLRRLLDASNVHIERCIFGEFRKYNEKYHDFTENVIRCMALESC